MNKPKKDLKNVRNISIRDNVRQSTARERIKNKDNFLQKRRKIDSSCDENNCENKTVKDPRRVRLLQWKAQRDALKEAHSTKKRPPFLAGVYHAPVNALETINSNKKKAATNATIKKRAEPAASKDSLRVENRVVEYGGRVTRARAAALAQASSKTPAQPTTSFAPVNKVFKPPIGLTIPSTPQTLRRNKQVRKLRKSPFAIDNILEIASTASKKKEEIGQQSCSNLRVSKTPPRRIFGKPVLQTPRRSGRRTPAKVKSDAIEKAEKSTGGNLRKAGRRTPGKTVPVACQSPTKIKRFTPKNSVQTPRKVANHSAEAKRGTLRTPVQKTSTEIGPVCSSFSKATEVSDASMDHRFPVFGVVNQSFDLIDLSSPVSTNRMSIHGPTEVLNKTPKKLPPGTVPAQFSPYVIAARGNERHKANRRMSIASSLSPEEISRYKDVDRFRSTLQREVTRLTRLCEIWEQEKDAAPSSVEDEILRIVGQTKLLMTDKFRQFERLIDDFEKDTRIMPNDLTGFWEMILLTVGSLDKGFGKLEELKANNWNSSVEDKSKPTKSPSSQKTKVKKLTASVNKATDKLVDKAAVRQPKISKVMEAIKRMREKRALEAASGPKSADEGSSETKIFWGGGFTIESPVRSSPADSITPTAGNKMSRRSLLQQALTNSASKVCKTPQSPAAAQAQIAASQKGKRFSVKSTTPISTSSMSSTAASKSILKSSQKNVMSDGNTTKYRVAFNFDSPTVDVKPSNSENMTPELRSPKLRRSMIPTPTGINSTRMSHF